MTAAGLFLALMALAAAQPEAAPAAAPDPLVVAGSSTVAPFAQVVAAETGIPAVITETGTAQGLAALCAPEGRADIAAASRPVSARELKACAAAGVTALTEIVIGLDAIVLAQSESAAPLDLAPRDLYLALASEVPASADDCRLVPNRARRWRDLRPDLPDRPIAVYGPPRGSGTRAMLSRLGIEEGAYAVPCAAALAAVDAEAFRRSLAIRSDGAWTDAGESDGALAFALTQLRDAVGVFGLVHARHQEGLTVLPMGGVEPTGAHIASGRYRLGRPLYLYTHAEKRDDPRISRFLGGFVLDDEDGPGRLLLRMSLTGAGPDNPAANIDTATGTRREPDQPASFGD